MGLGQLGVKQARDWISVKLKIFKLHIFSADLLYLASIYINREDCVEKMACLSAFWTASKLHQEELEWVWIKMQLCYGGLKQIGKALSLISPNAPLCFAALLSMVWWKDKERTRQKQIQTEQNLAMRQPKLSSEEITPSKNISQKEHLSWRKPMGSNLLCPSKQ